jgi:hypothetical protein
MHLRTADTARITVSARSAARNRYWAALRVLDERRIDFETSPSDLTAEQVRWAEIELEDAIAIAGELQILDVPWALS